jgi:hypothetical protein
MAESALLIEDGMMSSVFIKSLFDEKKDVERVIKNICSSINAKEDPINVLSDMNDQQRKEISDKIRKLNPKCKYKKYTACMGDITNYGNEKNIQTSLTSSYLPATGNTPFNVDIPIDNDRLYIGDQYMRTTLRMETMSQERINYYIANPPPGISLPFEPNNIRFIQDITLKSDITPLQSFNQNIILFMDKEFIPHRSKNLWNSLIGHDMGDKFEVILPDTAAVEIRKIKIGAQTPKSLPDSLSMFIPLWYDFNIDPSLKLNTGVFRQGSLSFEGNLAPASYMAVAEYYDDAIGVYTLETPKVSLDNFSLVGSYTKLTEYLHALNIKQPWSRIVSIIKEEKHILHDLDKKTSIKSKSIAEMLTACIRPSHYESDFDLWTYFCPVTDAFVQVPILINSPGTLIPGHVAVGRASYKVPVNVIKNIGVMSDGIELKEITDPFFYSTLLTYKDGFKSTDLKPDSFTGLYHFKFNEQFPYKQFSALMNFAALDASSVEFEFMPGMVNNENILSQKWETIFFIHTLNVFKSYERSMGLNYVH